MKDLIKVNGVNEYFCDIIFVTELYINEVKRDDFPRNIHWLLSEVRQQKKQSELLKKYRKNMSLLMMNIGNLYNCINKIYGLKKISCYTKKPRLIISLEFINDFIILIQSNKFIPNKYIIRTKYVPCIIHYKLDSIYFNIVKIKPQAISYLKQVLDKQQLKRFDKIIKVIEMMGEQHNENIDFDEYINNWCERLLKETK